MKALFSIPKQDSSKNRVSELQKKVNNVVQPQIVRTVKSSKDGVIDRLNNIKLMVSEHLGKYKDDYIVIRDEESFIHYIDNCIIDGECAIDTETSGLSPILDEIAGMSIYSPSQKAAYIPIHHKSYITGLDIDNQLSTEFLKIQLQRLVDTNVKVIMFNAKFDIRFIHNKIGIKLPCYFDVFIAARLLNENEESNALKKLHNKYCLNGEADAFTFDELFEGFNFQYIPVNTGYIYAARDAEITYQLYQHQLPYLTVGTEQNIEYELEGVSNVFWNIEMPVLEAFIALEDTGVALDMDKCQQLHDKYTELLKQREEEFWNICNNYENEISAYRRLHRSDCKLDDPINIGSPSQIAILLYDILKLPPTKKYGRATGEDAIKALDHPIGTAILNYRGVVKLLSTYIDKMPNIAINGRIYAGYKQIGADTGRVSSENPNLQNIPSHAKEIRQIFKADAGYIMLSSDYSAQEPRLTAHLSNDQKMIQAYKDGKDLYSEIASLAFDMPYEDCREFDKDGNYSKEGYERRGTAKVIVLGVSYGMGIKTIAENLKVSVKKAQTIYNKVMQEFPGLQKFVEDNKIMAREKGYVTTVWGRKRRLPDMQLSPYEVELKPITDNFDPLSDDNEPEYADDALVQYYINKLEHSWGSAKYNIIAEAEKDGIKITDNTSKIATAERQSTNARIQGSAADQTKKAMILINDDELMKKLGFKMLIPVHDEIVGEAPIENAKEAGKRLSELMIEAAKDLKVPSKCDVEYFYNWAGESIEI